MEKVNIIKKERNQEKMTGKNFRENNATVALNVLYTKK